MGNKGGKLKGTKLKDQEVKECRDYQVIRDWWKRCIGKHAKQSTLTIKQVTTLFFKIFACSIKIYFSLKQKGICCNVESEQQKL